MGCSRRNLTKLNSRLVAGRRRLSFLALAVLAAVAAARTSAAELGQLDASPTLFAVMAAINAAGYDADLQSPSNHPLRDVVRRELARRNIPCLEELKTFFEQHRKSDWSAELAQYISFGLVAGDPPDFKFRLRRNELPPDVLALAGFQQLLARFYKEAGIEELWRKAQPEIDAAIARYHGPVTRAVTEVSAYLRAETGGYSGWRFQVFVELLAAPNQIHSRSYGNEYFIVVTPSPEPQIFDVRHAYLHYLVDPIVTRYSEDVMKKKAVGDYALGAPYLDDSYKEDFLLLTGECLIKAIESRLEPGPASTKQALVERALSQGYILTPHFAEQLVKYEAQDAAMRFYFPQMVAAIDFRKEERRLAALEFSNERPVRKAKPAPKPKAPERSPEEELLEQAEAHYAEKRYAQARELYLKVLETEAPRPLQAQAYYGLARIAALEKNPELAEKLFLQTLESSPDPQIAAWTHVFLGRLADLAGEREKAEEHYRAAVSLPGASEAARKAAAQGIQEGFRRPQ